MKIVILDGFSAVRNDLSWKALEEFGQVIAYDRTKPDQILDRCRNAEVVLTNKVILTAQSINSLPELRYIGVLATGYNVVDLDAASKRGIVVTNIPAYSTESVAQLIFAHILNVVCRTDYYADQNRQGRWGKEPDMCYLDHSPFELSGKQIAFFGVGNIASAAIRIALAFGMKVVAVTSRSQENLPDGVKKVTAEEAFRTSRIIALTCPLTDSNLHMINAETLAMMNQDAIVINTSRGPLVDDQAMADALHNGVIAAYCADVVTKEPPVDGNPLFAEPHCYTTPHIAWATLDARSRLVEICARNLELFLAGTPQNVVNNPQ